MEGLPDAETLPPPSVGHLQSFPVPIMPFYQAGLISSLRCSGVCEMPSNHESVILSAGGLRAKTNTFQTHNVQNAQLKHLLSLSLYFLRGAS
jgi:hypothetical protein